MNRGYAVRSAEAMLRMIPAGHPDGAHTAPAPRPVNPHHLGRHRGGRLYGVHPDGARLTCLLPVSGIFRPASKNVLAHRLRLAVRLGEPVGRGRWVARAAEVSAWYD
ncbi:hypothetical protein SHIRM173S_03382 [Streptomyces hirsutus]